MRYQTGDIWDLHVRHSGWIVIPTNTTIRQDGLAVMGAGLAKEAATKYPHLPKTLASHIRHFKERPYIDYPIICLPTKHNWRTGSNMDLIEQGCRELMELDRILSTISRPDLIFLPTIGCGLGGLNWERQVRPVVDSILTPDRFVLVERP